MKRLVLTMLSLCMVIQVTGQNYISGSSTGTSSDFVYNTNGTAVLSITSQDVLSSWQSLPFSWEFYGQTVTGYYVSDNGYITFDNGASTSDPNNTAIPAAGGPNNAIYAFWDDLSVVSGSGSVDEVMTWTYGTAPTRTHVIEWFSVTPTVSGSGFVYAAIRIYECGDFDIVLNYGNATGMTGTVGCENATGSSATQLAGSPNYAYPSVGSAQDDDKVFYFAYDGTSYDLALSAFDLGPTIGIGSNNLTGTVTNYGGQTVTSFEMEYTVDGGAPVTGNITGVSIAPGATYNFTHPTPLVVSGGGISMDVCMSVASVNSNTDMRSCNDEMCQTTFSNNGTSASKRVIIEEFTGAWCGWCPDGAVVVDGIQNTHPTDVVAVQVHDGDAMEFSDGIRTAYNVTAYPNGQIDRFLFDGESKIPHSRGAWAANTNTRLASYTPVTVNVGSSYNSTTREVVITAEAVFVDYAAGDLRFVIEVIEDSLVGSGTGWDQVNYLNTTAGHPYQGAGDPIIGYVHNHVLRALPGGAMGNSGVIPANVNPGTVHYETFNYTLPANFDENNIHIIAMVYNYNTDLLKGEVLNVGDAPLGEELVVAIEEPVNGAAIVGVYPNPTAGNGYMRLNFTEVTQAEVAVYNAFGQKVAVLKEGSFAPGEHSVYFDVSDVAAGVYYFRVFTDKGAPLTHKVVVSH